MVPRNTAITNRRDYHQQDNSQANYFVLEIEVIIYFPSSGTRFFFQFDVHSKETPQSI